jgi:hypothetical protein
MREHEMRKMLRQDVRGGYAMRPLHEFVVTRTVPEQRRDEFWSFSWDGGSLQYAAVPVPPPAADDN